MARTETVSGWLGGLLGLAAFLAAPLAVAQIPDNPGAVPSRPVDSSYVGAYLVWAGGKGGIAWSAEASSDDPGGPTREATVGVTTGLGWQARSMTGSEEVAGQRMIPSDLFTSAPVPSTIVLNVTRPLQLDLYTTKTGSSCPLLDVELRVDGVFLAGQIAGPSIAFNAPKPPDAAGHCAHAFRMHPELDSIPAGDVIELRIITQRTGEPFRYGLAGNHRSVLWLASWEPHEAALRLGSGYSGSGEREPTGGGMPLLMGLAPLGFARGRRLVPVAILLTVAFAGCMGGAPPATEDAAGSSTPRGTAVVTIVDPNPGAEQGTERGREGEVVGLVHDDLDLPIAGAHVALLGTSHFQATSSAGEFHFANVTAGTHRIRVDKAEYHSYEGDLQVEAGKITRVQVQLGLAVDKAAGFRPHRHDDWLGKKALKVLDDDFEFTMPVSYFYGDRAMPDTACVGTSAPTGIALLYSYCKFEFRLPQQKRHETNLVLPGTRDVEVKVTWDPMERVDRVGLGFVGNHEPLKSQNFSMLYPRKSGDPFHVRSTWEMTDVGHQKYSTWRFFLFVPTNARGEATPQTPYSQPRATAQAFLKPIHIQLLIHQGTIPLEPAHREFWGGNTSLPLIVNSTQQYAPCFCDFPNKYFTWNSKARLVPPETTWVAARLRVEGTSLPVYAWTLLVKPANVMEGADAYDVSEYRRLTPRNNSPNDREYVVVLQEGEADPYYARSSEWNWLMDDGSDVLNVDLTDLRFTLSVTAHQGSPPA